MPPVPTASSKIEHRSALLIPVQPDQHTRPNVLGPTRAFLPYQNHTTRKNITNVPMSPAPLTIMLINPLNECSNRIKKIMNVPMSEPGKRYSRRGETQ